MLSRCRAARREREPPGPRRDLSRHRTPPPAALRRPGRRPRRLHHHGPGRRRRPDAARPRRAGSRGQEEALPEEGNAALHLLDATSTPSGRSRRSSRRSSRPSWTTWTRSGASSRTTRRGRPSRNLVDYDDLLLFWLAMVTAPTALAERITALYDHILVDEYQDTNLLQARVLQAMCRGHQHITVVGDDAQSIYSFRGASFRNILDFPAQFPGATLVPLEQNYRSVAAHPRRHQHAHRARLRALHEEPVDAPGGGRPAVAGDGAGRAAADAVRRRAGPRAPRGGDAAPRDRGALPRRLHVGRPRDRADEPEDPLREVGGPQVPRGGAREGRPGLPARDREPARRGELVSRAAAPAGDRRRDGARHDRDHGARTHGTRAPSSASTPPPRARPAHTALGVLLERLSGDRGSRGGGERHRAHPRAVRRHPAGALRPRGSAARRPRPAAGDRRRLSEPGRLPRGPRARAPAGHPGPGRRRG